MIPLWSKTGNSRNLISKPMRNQNKNPLVLTLAVFTIITALSLSAYTILYGGNEPVKMVQSNAIITQNAASKSGPIKFTGSLDNNYYFENNSVYLYVDIEAEKMAESRERTPMNISIVIDRSGSMGEKNKLEYVKKAVDYIIDESGSDDYISVVTYDDYVDVLQRSMVIRDKYELREKINKLTPGGFTNLSGGMFEGYDQVDKSYMRGYVNKVFLLSDGLANRGITDRKKLSDMVREKNRKDGITISTFGVGNDFNENMMADIADYGKGNYYYIKNSSDIPEIFASELRGIRNLVGQGTKLKVRFPSGYLKPAKVFGYPYEVNGDVVEIDFKDVFSGQKKSVLIKFDITRKIDKKLKFENELVYEDVTSDFKLVTENGINELIPASNKEDYSKNRNETVVQNVAMFEANELMEEALREVDNGNYSGARDIMKNARGYMDDQLKEVAPSPEMKRQSENIDRYTDELETVETKSSEEKSEMQKSGKYDNYNTRKKNE